MKLNELLEKLASELGGDCGSNMIHQTSSDFRLVMQSPQGLEFLEAVYRRGCARGFRGTSEWQSIKSEIEGEG